MPKIRPFTKEDTQAVMNLWYDTTVYDQDFIPRAFWDAVRPQVTEHYLPASDTWVACDEKGAILGFISLLEDLIGALFVRRDCQSRGIGQALIIHAAGYRSSLCVEVYEKNQRAIAFYCRCGFVETNRFTQEETGERVIRKVRN